MNEVKPGKKTTEFWVTIGAAAISILIVYGVLNQEQAVAWQELLTALAPLIAVALSYPLSRGMAKKQ